MAIAKTKIKDAGGFEKYIQGYPIKDLIDRLDNDEVLLNALYQRGLVWKRRQKSKLIDSILRGYDLPKIYAREVSGQADTLLEIIDGKQRISVLEEFKKNKLRIDNGTEIDGVQIGAKTYAQLPKNLRRRFDMFELHCVVYEGGVDDETCRDIFRRQQQGTPLNGTEKRATVSGHMAEFVKSISESSVLKKTSIQDVRGRHFNAAHFLVMMAWPHAPVSFTNDTMTNFLENQEAVDQNGPDCNRVRAMLEGFRAACGMDVGLSFVRQQHELFTAWASYLILTQDGVDPIDPNVRLDLTLVSLRDHLSADKLLPIEKRDVQLEVFRGLSTGAFCTKRDAIFKRGTILNTYINEEQESRDQAWRMLNQVRPSSGDA